MQALVEELQDQLMQKNLEIDALNKQICLYQQRNSLHQSNTDTVTIEKKDDTEEVCKCALCYNYNKTT